jgi:hypothetical protein
MCQKAFHLQGKLGDIRGKRISHLQYCTGLCASSTSGSLEPAEILKLSTLGTVMLVWEYQDCTSKRDFLGYNFNIKKKVLQSQHLLWIEEVFFLFKKIFFKKSVSSFLQILCVCSILRNEGWCFGFMRCLVNF